MEISLLLGLKLWREHLLTVWEVTILTSSKNSKTMIDLNKKYRTRRGGEVVGLVQKGDSILGWEAHNHNTLPRIWYASGKYACEESPYDLIEVDPKQDLLEEARRRYPVRTNFRQHKDYEVDTVVGEPFWENGQIVVKAQSGRTLWIWSDRDGDGKWAEIVKEHIVWVSFYEDRACQPWGIAATASHVDSNSNLLIAKKKITFYEGEGI